MTKRKTIEWEVEDNIFNPLNEELELYVEKRKGNKSKTVKSVKAELSRLRLEFYDDATATDIASTTEKMVESDFSVITAPAFNGEKSVWFRYEK